MLKTLLEGLKSFVVQPQDPTLPPERREPVRARCHLPVTVTDGDEARGATITDLSTSGLRLKMTSPPKSNRVSVSHSSSFEFELDTVRCDVLWKRKRRFSNDYMVGLLFTDDPSILERSWVSYALSTLGLNEQAVYKKRSHLRVDASVPVDVYADHGIRITEATAQNLGMGGALLSSGTELERHTHAEIRLGPIHRLPMLVVKGMILGRRIDEDGKTYLTSVKFEDLTAEQLKLLGKYVVLLLKESSGLYGK